mgnify:CR=1 FL=1
MAKPKIEEEIVEVVIPEEEEPVKVNLTDFDLSSWTPKTQLGKKVKEGEIRDIRDIIDKGLVIRESEIVDALVAGLDNDLLMIGQSKGKFGGGARRVFRQTQKKTREGNKPKFATMAIIGNKNGLVGMGYGKAKETIPAREKAVRNAKLNMIYVNRGCGSWECSCNEGHTVPFKVSAKCSSVIVTLMPAPKGTGLKIEKECAKILKLAGIKDVWSRTTGQTVTKINLVKACFGALKKISETKVK